MRILCREGKQILGLCQRLTFVANLVSKYLKRHASCHLLYFIFTHDICIRDLAFSYFLVSELFLELSSCLRLPTEQTMDEQPQGRHVHPGMYSANQLVLTVENRDSMAFLAAVFTGELSMYTQNK